MLRKDSCYMHTHVDCGIVDLRTYRTAHHYIPRSHLPAGGGYNNLTDRGVCCSCYEKNRSRQRQLQREIRRRLCVRYQP